MLPRNANIPSIAIRDSAQLTAPGVRGLPECGALHPLPVRLRGHRDLTQRESREQAAVKVREMDQYPDPSSHCRCRPITRFVEFDDGLMAP